MWDKTSTWGTDNKSVEKVDTPKTKATKRRKVACYERSDKHVYRRAFSELRLIESMNGEKIKENTSYNYITGGDVDQLSYLMLVLLNQNLEHCLFSTWCMSAEDILYFEEALRDGKIKKLDAYVGEIFPNSYKIEYKMLRDMFNKHECGRIAVFRNHSKIIAGKGEKFDFAVQTSANMNTNPRTESGCLTTSTEAYQFYKDYFDGIKSFE